MSRFIIRYVVIENREVNLCNMKKEILIIVIVIMLVLVGLWFVLSPKACAGKEQGTCEESGAKN
jgi:hypothetical protein